MAWRMIYDLPSLGVCSVVQAQFDWKNQRGRVPQPQCHWHSGLDNSLLWEHSRILATSLASPHQMQVAPTPKLWWPNIFSNNAKCPLETGSYHFNLESHSFEDHDRNLLGCLSSLSPWPLSPTSAPHYPVHTCCDPKVYGPGRLDVWPNLGLSFFFLGIWN